MLGLMNRRNKLKSDLELFEFIASKNYALGTDFIVGHPGETEAIWREAIENIKRFPLTHLHGFTYSKRDGTPSATMSGQVNGDIAKKRLAELTSIIDEKNYNFRQQQKNIEVLIEQEKDGKYLGYDQFFNQIEVKSDADLVGDWINLSDFSIDKDLNRGIF
jgi:tRNA A37 methylthiotransferase MiaB